MVTQQDVHHKILEHAPVRIFWKDSELRYLGCNTAFARDAGLTDPEELIGKDDHQLPWRDQAERYRADDRMVMESGQSKIRYEEPQTTPDGRTIWLRTSKVPLRDASGKIIGVLGIYDDITQLKELEEQYRQAQKMEAVGQLAGGVAHDFNNLLTAILASTDLLLETLPAYHPGREDALETRKAALRAADLTRQLLAFGRRQVLQPRVLDVNELVDNLGKMLRRLIGEDIDLRTELPPDLGAVRADPGQLEQVIMNLAINARDAMPNGGKLTIETANVLLDDAYVATHTVVLPGPYVMIAGSDTGVGMDAATKARVFEPFFTTMEKGKGTGLGLSTVYGIVKQSGGYVWVYSEPGLGTAFKIYLPRVEGTAEPVLASGSVSQSPRGTETVLLCEDQQEVRSLTHRILVAHGYDVLVAASGEEAVELAQAWPGAIDLLLTDVVMPGMSGPKLVRQLAPIQPAMKVLYVSGYADEAIVRHRVVEPGMAFLQKPFTSDLLARKIREVLEGGRQ